MGLDVHAETIVVAVAEPDGEVRSLGQDRAVTIANVGHLSPYLDRVEVPVIAGVPLGIDPSVDYEESEFALPMAGSLTFVSDGIIEARNASGELFGFDRTLQLSNSGASAIAQAALKPDHDRRVNKSAAERELCIAAHSSR